jgi:hypothetical protein
MKEKRPKETPNHDPIFGNPEQAFAGKDRLALPPALKKILMDAGYDWRFLNSREYREAGNTHRSNWQAFNPKIHLKGVTIPESIVLTPEGTFVRKDLVLGVRPKSFTAYHRRMLDQRNAQLTQAAFNKRSAAELRQHAKDIGLSSHVAVEEGYGKDADSGYKAPEFDQE